ncbi:MAG: cytochrome c biogenesis protein CcsA, partial [Pseudomonadales bacterium]
PGVSAHVVLSILAYGLITIATASALVMSYASYQLKHKHIHALGSLMPPLETIEKMLFEMILAGELFLTASIITGILFHEDFFAQHLIHKTFFSMLSWLIFAVLLVGHHVFGWRGTKAMKLTVSGFITLLLAYVGSKFVIEMILV